MQRKGGWAPQEDTLERTVAPDVVLMRHSKGGGGLLPPSCALQEVCLDQAQCAKIVCDAGTLNPPVQVCSRAADNHRMPPPPPSQTKVTIVGENEIYR